MLLRLREKNPELSVIFRLDSSNKCSRFNLQSNQSMSLRSYYCNKFHEFPASRIDIVSYQRIVRSTNECWYILNEQKNAGYARNRQNTLCQQPVACSKSSSECKISPKAETRSAIRLMVYRCPDGVGRLLTERKKESEESISVALSL